LHYALPRALAQGWPTLFLDNGLPPLFLDSEGTRWIAEDKLAFELPGNCLILFDSSREQPELTSHLNNCSIVQTSSPNIGRWKEWVKIKRALFFVMDLWSGK
jgi:hypothetical protein